MKKNFTLKWGSALAVLLNFMVFWVIAQCPSDNAGNYSSWTNGSNGGTGFNPWVITAPSNAANGGFFRGSSTDNDNGIGGLPNINTGGNAFGLYSNSDITVEAVRQIANAGGFGIGQTLTFSMDNGGINTDKVVGFSLRNDDNENLMEIYFRGGQANYEVNDAGGQTATSIGFTRGGIDVSITRTGTTSYSITIIRKENSASQTLTRNFISRTNSTPRKLRFFNFQAGSNAPFNFYFNNINITTPAPTGSLEITNSSCVSNCTVTGGSILLGTVASPNGGGTIEYSTNNGSSWSSGLPAYVGGLTILARVTTNGCSSTSTQVGTTVAGTCTTPTAPGIGTITHPTVCNLANGSVQLTGLPSGNWTVTTSPGNVAVNGSGTTTTITGLAAGNYTFTVTNSSGCTSSSSGTATLTAVVSCLNGTITGATTVNCFSDFNVTLTAAGSGGTAPYTYLWSTTQSGAVINNAGAGTYSVTISDASGQTKVVNHTITQPDAVSGTLVVTHQKCLDPDKGSIVVTGSGGNPGYTYALNFGAFGPSNSFTVLDPGKYTVNIKDANGCQGKLTTTVRQLASSMTLSAVRTGIITCGGTGSITATAGSGQPPYEYKLGAGAFQPSGTFTGLAAGTYSITAKDAIGCTITRSYSVVDNGKDSYEGNNTLTAAINISLSSTIVARIGTATDQDWFKFNTGSGTDFDITLSHGSVTYSFDLFTSANVLVPPTSSGSGIKSYVGLAAGTVYRIRVTGAQSFECYNLQVENVSAPATGAEMLTMIPVVPGELKAQPFPNPHNGSFILQVESPVTGKGNIVLYDLQGRTMVTREENLRAGTNQVRFSNLQPINYFYRVMVDGKAISGKVFKQ